MNCPCPKYNRCQHHRASVLSDPNSGDPAVCKAVFTRSNPNRVYAPMLVANSAPLWSKGLSVVFIQSNNSHPMPIFPLQSRHISTDSKLCPFFEMPHLTTMILLGEHPRWQVKIPRVGPAISFFDADRVFFSPENFQPVQRAVAPVPNQFSCWPNRRWCSTSSPQDKFLMDFSNDIHQILWIYCCNDDLMNIFMIPKS